MNFGLSHEQQALQDSLQRLLRDTYGFERRRAVAASQEGWCVSVWQQMGALGTCGLLVPESAGGFGGRCEDVLPVMQSLGAALSLEPYLATAVLAASALRAVPPAGLAQEALERIAGGSGVLAWSHDEPGMRDTAPWVETRAYREHGRWMLDGEKCNVLHGGHASSFVVTAHLPGAPADSAGLALFLVDAQSKGVQKTGYRLLDDSAAADLVLAGAAAEPLCLDDEQARAAVQSTLNAGIAAACADATGAAAAAFELAAQYIQTRQQFGRAIGENQAPRHRLAEMFVSLEMCRSMAIAAAVAADDPDAPGAAADLMRAKMVVGKHARAVCHGAIQLHGGIGMTEEYAVGHYLRRVTLLDLLFGGAEAHAAQLGDLLAVQAAA
jgi:pimeloyl-CoA dehydrogenase